MSMAEFISSLVLGLRLWTWSRYCARVDLKRKKLDTREEYRGALKISPPEADVCTTFPPPPVVPCDPDRITRSSPRGRVNGNKGTPKDGGGVGVTIVRERSDTFTLGTGRRTLRNGSGFFFACVFYSRFRLTSRRRPKTALQPPENKKHFSRIDGATVVSCGTPDETGYLYVRRSSWPKDNGASPRLTTTTTTHTHETLSCGQGPTTQPVTRPFIVLTLGSFKKFTKKFSQGIVLRDLFGGYSFLEPVTMFHFQVFS